MPEAVKFYYEKQLYTVYFVNPKALLPVKTSDGHIKLMRWGRRLIQPGKLPMGGWAQLQSIYKGLWNEYTPKPVKLPITQFMEKDFEGAAHWYDITPGLWVQGLIAQESDEVSLYIVTITPELPTARHTRWPRILA
ncbi:MAG: hypothetical protein P4M12_08120 [Gammaproteobacteria bacterium]|nr:hypothetical protein [Gammaproteobacteria bacterium]